MVDDAPADALHHEAHGLALDLGKPLDAQDTRGFRSFFDPGRQVAGRDGRTDREGHGLEVVVVVILAVAVMRGTGVEVVLGGGAQPEQHQRIDRAVLGLDHLHGAGQVPLDLGAHPCPGLGIEQVGLVEHDEVRAEELVLEHLLQRVVVVDRRVGGALGGERLGILREGAGGDVRTSVAQPETTSQTSGGYARSVEPYLGPLGDPFGLRPVLKERGIQYSLTYITDVLGNPTGGCGRGRWSRTG